MNKKIISAMLFGAMLIAPGCTFVSCSDYDAEIAELRDQISVQASSLKELSDEKLANVTAEIELLKAEAEDIREAYEAADNATQQATLAAAQALVEAAQAELEAALKAAEERIAANEGSIAALIEADATLQTAIDAAQARADKAYELAVSAAAQAEKNADDIKKISEDLDAIRTTLAAQISVLGDEVKALSATIGEQQAAIEAQQAAIEALQKDQAEIAKVNETIAQIQSEIAANKAALEKMITDEVAAVSAQITTINASIETLTAGYQAADAALKVELDGLKTALETTNTNLTNLSDEIAKVNGLVDVLFTDLGNLITGVILQDDSQVENVYARVTNWTTNPGGQTYTYYDRSGTQPKVYFPYKKPDGSHETLYQNQYNVESEGGYLYVTINPNTINFAGQSLSLLNSLDNASDEYTLEKAAVSERTTAITRAAEKTNGLYQVALTNNFNKGNYTALMNRPTTSSNVAYALAAPYKAKVKNAETGKVEEVTRYVYSKYELKLNATPATALTNVDFSLNVKNGNGTQTYPSAGYSFKVSGLEGVLELLPAKAVPAKSGKKVYKKYIECVNAVAPSATSTKVQAAVNAMNTTAGLCTVLGESDGDLYNKIEVSVPEQYNGYIFTYDYYIWNYDGSIYKNTYTVIYTKPLIEAQTIELFNTPNSNSTRVEAEGRANSKFGATLCMTDRNADWINHVDHVKVEGVSGNLALIDAVTFFDNATVPAQVLNVPVISGSSAATQISTAQARKIKNMTITYNPANFVLGKKYTIPVVFYNAQGNEVNTVNVEFTMQKPVERDDLINRIPVAFVEGTNTTIAWAKYDPTTPGYGYYELSGSYNNVIRPLDSFDSFIRFNDPTVYSASNGNLAYKPTLFPGYYNSTKMIVPNAAIDRDTKGTQGAYLYNLQAGVQYYGFSNLWQATENFQLKWESPIYHAGWQNVELTVGYPGNAELTQANIKSDDPSIAGTNNWITYFGASKDNRIASIEIEAVNPTSENTGLFTNYEVLPSTTAPEKVVFETGGSVAMQGPAAVEFMLKITDVFGCVKERKITVKVDPNEAGANKK